MISKIIKIFFYYKYDLFRKIRILFKINQKIFINGYELTLPPGHLLTMYDYLYPQYDKFILKLANTINKDGSIIDIGANVGDTLVRLINSKSESEYYSIEADEYFFKYLQKNKEKIISNNQSRITLIKELVGIDLVGNLSSTTTGTKSLVINNNGLKTKKLDDIIVEYNIKNISLIKVDVDGYDYNVLLSGMDQIKKYKPILFFEYMSLISKIGYLDLINKLYKIGYNKWTALDNYGEIIFEDKDYKDIVSLIELNKINHLDICCRV